MDNQASENLFYLRHHLLAAARFACALALEWGDEENPDPGMKARAVEIFEIADAICPSGDEWKKEGKVIPFPYDRVRSA